MRCWDARTRGKNRPRPELGRGRELHPGELEERSLELWGAGCIQEGTLGDEEGGRGGWGIGSQRA